MANELEAERINEKERCLAWVQYARSQGEHDMRQLRYWIETDEWPEED